MVCRWTHPRSRASESMTEFAGRFLGGMYEDGAVVPTNLSASAPEVLALTLLQHRTSPLSAGAWLNLGFRTSARGPSPSQ